MSETEHSSVRSEKNSIRVPESSPVAQLQTLNQHKEIEHISELPVEPQEEMVGDASILALPE